MTQMSSEIQVVLSQITQLQSELQDLSSRVSDLEQAGEDVESGGAGGRARTPGQDYIGGDGGTFKGNTSDSEPVTGSLRFKTADDANVVVRTLEESDGSDDGTVEIGVYYV